MVTWYIHANFSTTVSKMAMKHYHHFGYDARGRQLLNILSEEFRSYPWGTWVKTQKDVKSKMVLYSPAKA
jgi:hypothetical protein